MPGAVAGDADERPETVKVEVPFDGVGIMAPCPTSTAPEILSEGVATTGTDTTTADCHYKITVANPAGMRLRAVVEWIGSSDHDVYVKQGTPATASPYYCSEQGTSTVSPAVCAGGQLVAGDYFLRVKRWTGSADFTLTVFIEPLPPTCSFGTGTVTLVDGVVRTDSLTNDAGATCHYVFFPDPAQASSQFTMNPGSNDFDLYVKVGSPPTTTSYDCRPFSGSGVTEVCTVANTGAPVYAMVVRFSGSGSFTIMARAFSACSYGTVDQALDEDTPFSGSLSADAGGACYVKFDAASGYDIARLTLTPNAGSNFDLYLRVGARPTTSTYTCRSILTGLGAADSCDVPGDAGTVYGMILRVSGSGGFTVSARSLTSCSLGPGVHPLPDGDVNAALANVVGAKCLFEHTPSPSADFVRFTLPPTTPADFDMYVRKGALPGTAIGTFDCRPYLGGSSTETCESLVEDATPYYVMVLRFSGSGAFTLNAQSTVIPTLENGVAVTGVVAHGALQYYKVVLPAADEDGYAPSQLAIALVGDNTAAACATLDANTAPGTCAQLRNPRPTACGVADGTSPGTCASASQAAADACAEANGVNPGTCSGLPPVQVAAPNADLWVRHRVGLPTATAADCRGASAGSTESCVFSSEGTQARADAAAQYAQARGDAWTAARPLCPDLAACGTNPLPAFPPMPAQANLVPFQGGGKYFVAVRGTTGPADFALVAAWA
ncbi:MAG TPA: PPC domain-containing protein [Candidatus Thermoplasmatota archaeon]|nr:PPC domain-containing protein [Candidatus Thermoplasmatota archaeon]